MTIDEALDLVQQTEECWIVWNSQTGEVLSVTGTAKTQSPQERFAQLATMKDYGVPVASRHFQSSKVGRDVLKKQRDEFARIQTRVRVLTAWSAASTEELVRILERAEYQPPMQKEFDSRVIVDHLWELHRYELTPSVRERLGVLLTGDILGETAVRKLRVALAALAGDESFLKAVWVGDVPGRECLQDAFDLMNTFEHVRTQDPRVVGDIAAFLDMGMPFGGKYDAMIALGQIGPPAALVGVEPIRRAVHDSEPWIIAARDCVLERLEHGADWPKCPDCCHGRVHSASGRGAQPCPTCLGIGYRRAL